MATKLSMQLLRENYAHVDPLALDAIFEANNYNYSHTVTALNASLGTKPRSEPRALAAPVAQPPPVESVTAAAAAIVVVIQ